MSTPASGTSPYATASDLLARYDWRSVSQLLSDDGTVPPNNLELLDTSSDSGATLLLLLEEASGEVESVCTQGGSYVINPTATPPVNDLLVLTGNSAQLLKGMVCHLAMYLLWERRPNMAPKDLPPQVKRTLQRMEDLESGKAIFGILEKQAAGHMNDTVEQPPDVYARNGVVVQARPYFGRRSNQYPAPAGFGGRGC